jgi:hypothetical protein
MTPWTTWTIAATVAAALSSGSAQAQQETWVSSLTPGDALFVGWAHTLPHGDLWFHCAGSPDGRPRSPYANGIPPAFTHGLTVELRHAALGAGGPGAVRGDISLAVDGTRYALPPMTYRNHGGLAGWVVDLSMGDALFTDIRDGGAITLFAGDTPIASHAGAIATAVAEVTRFCADQYARTGTPLPAHAAAAVSAAPAPQAAAADTVARMVDTVRAHCGEPFDILPDQPSWTTVELNGDGRPDTILFWSAVSCRVGPYARSIGGGNCGASQCLTSIFISGTGRGAQADAEFFTQGPVIDPARPGEVGFALRLGACREAGLMPDCVTWHRWTGTELVRTN